MTAVILATFEKPTTKDFVWSCWGPSLRIAGQAFCYNFIFFLLTLSFVALFAFFFFTLRKPKVIPGKGQMIAEFGVGFVKEQIVIQMIGPAGMGFFAFLASLFFWILFGNIFEIVPFVDASMNARIAFPLVLASISWIVYNTVGIKTHGFFGYLKHVMLPPGVPLVLRPLMALIDFVSVIVFRPFTLTVRLFANMVAGHFLLAVFFLGTIALFETGNFLIIFGVFSGAMSVVFLAFEIFVSVLQAFIFAVLTASYIAEAMATEH